MNWITENAQTILTVALGVVAVASAIAKATPNTTDNKWVGYFHKGVDFFAMSTGKTELIKK